MKRFAYTFYAAHTSLSPFLNRVREIISACMYKGEYYTHIQPGITRLAEKIQQRTTLSLFVVGVECWRITQSAAQSGFCRIRRCRIRIRHIRRRRIPLVRYNQKVINDTSNRWNVPIYIHYWDAVTISPVWEFHWLKWRKRLQKLLYTLQTPACKVSTFGTANLG